MMLAVSANTVVRSSMEEMLESLLRNGRDEVENDKDKPPPSLPARPKPNSRARPPSKRRLPTQENCGLEINTGESPKASTAKEVDEVLENVTCQCLSDKIDVGKNGTIVAEKGHMYHHTHSNFHDLEGVVIALQSYVRGEIARKEFRRNMCKRDEYHKSSDDKQLIDAAVLIQSAMRGCMARRQKQQYFTQKTQSFKDLLPPQPPGAVEELQKRVLLAEAALGEKDKEITSLKEQVDQLESKMRAMEEMWQKKIEILQMNMGTSNKGAIDTTKESRKEKNGIKSPVPRSFNSEETSVGSLTPRYGSPVRFIDILCREKNEASSNSITPLVNEFEQQKQLFDLEAQAISESKQVNSPSAPKPLEEVHTLKSKFDAWKKDFGFRLKEAKSKASRMGQHEGDKRHRKWWSVKDRRS